MMAFVKHQKFEVVTQELHFEAGALVGRYTDWFEPKGMIANESDPHRKRFLNSVSQLICQRPSRSDKQRMGSNFTCNMQRDFGLACSRSHHHHSPLLLKPRL